MKNYQTNNSELASDISIMHVNKKSSFYQYYKIFLFPPSMEVFIIFFLIIDSLLTWYSISIGLYELNPVIIYFMHYGFAGILFMKCILASGMIILYQTLTGPTKRIIGILCCSIYIISALTIVWMLL